MRIRIATSSLMAAGVLAAGVCAQQMTTPAPPDNFGIFGSNGKFAFAWPGQSSAEAAHLAREYVKTEKEERKQEIRKKMHDLLTQQFDENTKQQQKELDDLEKQIANLRRTLEKRANNKSQIVDRRLEQLLLEADGMGWSSPNANQPFGIPGMGGIPVPPPAVSLPRPPKPPEDK